MKILVSLIIFLLSGIFSASIAVDTQSFKSAEHQQRYQGLIKELRCLVCQNQNLADSNADLAKDLRREVYQMVDRGETNESIIEFLASRYGDFVLYRPPFKASTALLWLGPFVLLIVGVVSLVLIVRRRATLTLQIGEAQRAHVRRLLNENSDNMES